jgi:hypothetical protein
MPSWTNIGDFTTGSLPNTGARGRQGYRPSNAANTYVPGIVLGYVAVDSQILPDFQTVQPLAAGTTTPLVAGVVAPDWAGFDNAGTLNASYLSAASETNVAGTVFINAVIKGIAYVWVDQSGSGAVTLTNGISLVSSRTTAGYAQGVAVATATAESAFIGAANLPASGIGSSLTAAALAQASGTVTLTGTPAAGDVINVVLGAPYTDLQPGTAQTATVSVTLNATTAATVTTAATALAAALNASPYFSVQTLFGAGNPPPYFLATSSAGVVTITVNTQANPFLVTGGTTNAAGTAAEQWRFFTFISGMVGNSITLSTTVSAGAGTISTASGATLASGTGYKGKVPAFIYGPY